LTAAPRSSSSLASLPVGAWAPVLALGLSEREAAWLRAVGLVEGISVMPLRKAPFGGPLHVRLSSGLELALDLSLARAVLVQAQVAALVAA
jgi:Fe2+ transport system protein FeoA